MDNNNNATVYIKIPEYGIELTIKENSKTIYSIYMAVLRALFNRTQNTRKQ